MKPQDALISKELLVQEIMALPDSEPMLKAIWNMLDARKKKPIRFTKHGRPIRSEEEMSQQECPYPYEPDL